MSITDILELLQTKIEAMNPVPKEFLVSKGNDNGFEKLVSLVADEIVSELDGTLKVIPHYGHHFPDMDFIVDGKRYGVELKSRNNGAWDTNGNSVFESISDEVYEEIFLFFGTKQTHQDRILVQYAPYWTVTASIHVTHSPRFKINMNTQASVFNNKQEYDQLRDMTEKEKVIFLQNYLKQNTTGVKWFVPQDSQSLTPTSLNTLHPDRKNRIKAEILVLYPQDLLTSNRADYARAHEFLIVHYFYYSSSFRDFFSAGGQWEYEKVKFPKAIETLYLLRFEIKDILKNANPEFKEIAYRSWDSLNIQLTHKSFIDDYDSVLAYIGKEHFRDELNRANIQNFCDLL